MSSLRFIVILVQYCFAELMCKEYSNMVTCNTPFVLKKRDKELNSLTYESPLCVIIYKSYDLVFGPPSMYMYMWPVCAFLLLKVYAFDVVIFDVFCKL